MKCVVVAGPTASGKSALTLALARQFSLPVLSADARQVYAEMHIGTARPLPEEWDGVPHYLLGHVSIHTPYDAHRYQADAEAVVAHLRREGHSSFVLVGGSGLYIQALLEGIDAMPPIPPDIRTEVRVALQHGVSIDLVEEIKRTDPVYAATADLNNPRRIQRAIEVMRASGKPFSAFRTAKQKSNYQTLWLMPFWKREELYARINERTEAMVSSGLETEARLLWQYKHLQALQTVGYREWFAHFEGKCTREETIEQIKMQTRRYAKRQITWFRNQVETVHMVEQGHYNASFSLIDAFLK